MFEHWSVLCNNNNNNHNADARKRTTLWGTIITKHFVVIYEVWHFKYLQNIVKIIKLGSRGSTRVGQL